MLFPARSSISFRTRMRYHVPAIRRQVGSIVAMCVAASYVTLTDTRLPVRRLRSLSVADDTPRTASLNVIRALTPRHTETRPADGDTEVTVGAMWSPVVNE